MLLISISEAFWAQQPANPESGRFPLITSLGSTDTLPVKKLFLQAIAVMKTQPDSATRLFHQGLLLSRQMGYPFGAGKNMLAIALMEGKKGDIRKAIHISGLAYPYCQLAKHPKLWLDYYRDRSGYYEMMGYNDTAIACCHKAIKIVTDHPEMDSSRSILCELYIKLGSIYGTSDQFDISLAISYLEKARVIAIRENVQHMIPDAYITLGGVYANQNVGIRTNNNGYKKGLQFIRKGISLGRASGDTLEFPSAYYNLAAIYANLGLPDSAEYYVSKATSSSGNEVNYGTRIQLFHILGVAYHKRNDFKKAEFYLLKAREMSLEFHEYGKLLLLDNTLANFYLSYALYEKAVPHLQQYALLRDSLITNEKIKATRQFEVKYQVAEKDKAMAINKLKLNQQQNKIKVQRLWLGASVAGLLLFSGLLLLLYRNNRHRRHLQEEKMRNLEHLQQIGQLKAMVHGEEQERGRLARELHDGIVGQLVAVKLNFSKVRQRHPPLKTAPDFEEAMLQLEDAALDLRKTAHNLMPEILIQQGFTDTLALYCEKMSKWAGFRIDFNLTGTLPALPADASLSLYRIVQELTQNIIKHAQATAAVVQIDCHPPQLLLTVEDNGKGMDPKLYQKESTLKTVRTRVQLFKGKMDLNIRSGEGTAITIEFDLKNFDTPSKPLETSTVLFHKVKDND